MAKKFPIQPKHPERICWGCDKYCPAQDLQCGNGCERIQHPIELNGEFWYQEGDWSGLIADDWQEQFNPKPKTTPTTQPENAVTQTQPEKKKPHFKLPLKK